MPRIELVRLADCDPQRVDVPNQRITVNVPLIPEHLYDFENFLAWCTDTPSIFNAFLYAFVALLRSDIGPPARR